MTMLAKINGYAGVWTFAIATCFVLFLLFGFNWVT